MSAYLKKHLTTQLELLDESSFHLQSSISDFIQQIKESAMECVEKTSGTDITLTDAITMVTSAQSTLLEQINSRVESTKLYPPTEKKTPAENKLLKPIHVGHSSKETNSAECNSDTIRRLEDVESAITSLQDTKQKTEDDMLEIKQWRDNCITEQSDLAIKIEKLSKKQKQDLKNLRKQINEQDNKIDELCIVIEKLEENESTKNKALEKMSLDLEEHENILHKINKEIQEYTYKIENSTQEINSLSGMIFTIQEDGKKNIMSITKTCEKLLTKHGVICKLLQQRLLSMDKLIESYNKCSESRERKSMKIETLEKTVLKLSQDCQTFANHIKEMSTPGFIASQGRWGFNDYFTFSAVERNVGNHFDPNTGEFIAPVDGLYKVSLTVKPTGGRDVGAGVGQKTWGVVSWLRDFWTKDKYVAASETFEVRMKHGDVLYSYTGYKDCECTHFSCSFIGV